MKEVRTASRKIVYWACSSSNSASVGGAVFDTDSMVTIEHVMGTSDEMQLNPLSS